MKNWTIKELDEAIKTNASDVENENFFDHEDYGKFLKKRLKKLHKERISRMCDDGYKKIVKLKW